MSDFQIQLETSTVLNIPLHTYDTNFLFIVNGVEYSTSRLVSDLLSPKISKIHFIDPTFDKFEIHTHNRGDFSNVLKLVNFNKIHINGDEFSFLAEVFEILGIESIKFNQQIHYSQFTFDNIFPQIFYHQKYKNFFNDALREEINFISTNFFKINQKIEENLVKLNKDVLLQIIENPNLQLIDEDQLFQFVNHLYTLNRDNTVFYEKICFSNVSKDAINTFLDIFDFNEMTKDVWTQISQRLKYSQPIINYSKDNRYQQKEKKKEKMIFTDTDKSTFSGIFNFLNSKYEDKIENEVSISSSSNYNEFCTPNNLTVFRDPNKFFLSKDEKDSWICFDFKNRQVEITSYEIKSGKWTPNNDHPKSWVIEGSNDEKEWEIIDERNDCSYLNGNGLIHKFDTQKKSIFRYIRMKLSSSNWSGKNCLAFDSIELYGTLFSDL